MQVLLTHNTDWLGKYRGSGPVVLKPKTTQEVSSILKYCNDNSIAVVPQGGNTGLVGGGVPVRDEIVLSTSLMQTIESFDPVSGILTCQAGCILESLDGYLADRGFCMPLDLGAKGSCQIGGNIATNAGGIRFVRYGSLHGTVLGLEVVLPDGTVVDTISPCRKDNTGYDIKQLFIGSEGTLGVVTRASLLTSSRASAVNVALLGCESYESVVELLAQARGMLGEVVSAVEFLDDSCMDVIQTNLPGGTNPLSANYPFYFLVETSGSNNDHDTEKLNKYLESVIESGVCVDGTVAMDTTQQKALWAIREEISGALLGDGYVYKYDISLPVSKMYDIVEDMRKRCEGLTVRVCGYGHIGDGNLHLNITSKEYNPELLAKIEPYVYEYTAGENGSVSAEHGLGYMKSKCIHYSKSPAAVTLMHQIKSLFDPKGILNPYKLLPPNSANK
ncbi:D-2-hydroxyglutarate dehydrogenase, mitochondrial [Sphaeroforma arctica JP610]|uniref:D-2-hydroxyglutarate dehydrogenase, mitochondrial n=1 Tax=Sphaeroforma arctica JP610 TaxID=667725 RepID=A0A0L0FXQ1_9EUKA|nr:D-2-hydroxyglutarate dehydrogenase, mitochondrial [Sphaeroforma arctica JP610]KNC81587.1 D-2-hydroxyglutarate dehydrogenase, mitochondrial [Sphaeroforma arctica JP610]|eukprot:XP_014155489.1 D-2-hydroxyglutarate dehydrogenase, mitochondrial [Sphaeroforma arctica JP610]